MAKKLYRVECRGMRTDVDGCIHGVAMVVAEDAGEAYQKVRNELDEKDLGFSQDRELESVTLVAEAIEYPDCRIQLYL